MKKETPSPLVVVVGAANASAEEAGAAVAVAQSGITLGLLPGSEAAEGSPWLSIAGHTAMGQARNAIPVPAGEMLIAIRSGPGTPRRSARASRPGNASLAWGHGTAAILPAELPEQTGALAPESGSLGLHGGT